MIYKFDYCSSFIGARLSNVKCQNASFEQASSSSRVISIKSIKQELVCWLLTRPGNNPGPIKPSHLTTMCHSLWSNPYFEHCSTVLCGNLFDACQPYPFLRHFMSFLSQYLIIQDEQRDFWTPTSSGRPRPFPTSSLA